MKKYEFIGQERVFEGRTLKRIRRLSDGLIGGWIESEANLSHEGECFVYYEAMVYDNAQVFGNAKVSDKTQIFDNVEVCDNAEFFGDAKVYGNAKIYGDARISGHARVYGNAWVYGDAKVYDNAWVCGNAKVYGKPWLRENFTISDGTICDKKAYGNKQLILRDYEKLKDIL